MSYVEPPRKSRCDTCGIEEYITTETKWLSFSSIKTGVGYSFPLDTGERCANLDFCSIECFVEWIEHKLYAYHSKRQPEEVSDE